MSKMGKAKGDIFIEKNAEGSEHMKPNEDLEGTQRFRLDRVRI